VCTTPHLTNTYVDGVLTDTTLLLLMLLILFFSKMWVSTLVDSESGGEVMDKEYGGLYNMGVVVVVGGVVVVTHILTPHGRSCDQIPHTQEPLYNLHQ
jgi:hypothetical protein